MINVIVPCQGKIAHLTLQKLMQIYKYELSLPFDVLAL